MEIKRFQRKYGKYNRSYRRIKYVKEYLDGLKKSRKIEIIELSPLDVCPSCEEYIKKGNEHICRINCLRSEDIRVIWGDCPYLHKKYRIREYIVS